MKHLIQIFAFICIFSVASFANNTKIENRAFSKEISTMTKKVKEIKSFKFKKKALVVVQCFSGNMTDGNMIIGSYFICFYSDGSSIANLYWC